MASVKSWKNCGRVCWPSRNIRQVSHQHIEWPATWLELTRPASWAINSFRNWHQFIFRSPQKKYYLHSAPLRKCGNGKDDLIVELLIGTIVLTDDPSMTSIHSLRKQSGDSDPFRRSHLHGRGDKMEWPNKCTNTIELSKNIIFKIVPWLKAWKSNHSGFSRYKINLKHANYVWELRSALR